MNEIKNKILLVGDKFMPEMHFRQPEFTQSSCGPFTKNKEQENLRNQDIYDLSTKTNQIKFSFNMT